MTWKFWCKDGIYGSWRIVLHEWENGCWESPTDWKSYHKSCRHKVVPRCACACGFSWISSRWTWKIYRGFHTYSSSKTPGLFKYLYLDMQDTLSRYNILFLVSRYFFRRVISKVSVSRYFFRRVPISRYFFRRVSISRYFFRRVS